MIHIKYPDKEQYSPKDVYTAAGRDYVEIYDESKDKWEKGKSYLEKRRIVTKEAEAELVQNITDGKVSVEDISRDRSLKLVRVYSKGLIDRALEEAARAKREKLKDDLVAGKLSLMNFFFTGKSGGGKTACARMFCDALKEWASDKLHEEWRYRMGATRNPIDDYGGEEIFVLNDIAGEKLDSDSWKGLLDPHEYVIVGTR